MNTLNYDNGTCEVRRGDKYFSSNGHKPELTFEYDTLFYDNFNSVAKRIIGSELTLLTDVQCAEIETFIDGLVADPQTQTNLESQRYLFETDWFVVRKAELGTPIPTNILVGRAAAREAIVQPN